jgi:acetyltransferase-like isoleucine patch superfamily enzyme
MMNIKGLRKIIPTPLKRFVRSKLNHAFFKIKAPRMVWGYQNYSGEWRPRTRISDTVFMYHPEQIRIGDNVFVWHYTILDGTGRLEIGEGSQIGAWVGIFTHSSHIAIRIYGNHYQEVPEQEKKGYPINMVKIGEYVFVGAGTKILPGVTIGKGALVSAGSIVNKNIGEFEIVSGNPTEVIGDTRELDRKYLSDPQIKEWYYEWQKK